MNDGWIKIHRKILDWEWYSEPNTFRLFFHCLLKANHTDKRWRGIDIPRGSFVTSYENLSKELKLSVQNIRTSLKKLSNLTNELTIKSTSQFTLITVVRYSDYQNDNPKLTSKLTSKLTNNQQTTNKRLTTTKNEKNEKNEKNNISRVELKKFDFYIKDLNQFWSRKFTVKGWKKKAFAKFLDLVNDGYTSKEFRQVFQAIRMDKFHTENNYNYVTPEYVVRRTTFEKYLHIND